MMISPFATRHHPGSPFKAQLATRVRWTIVTPGDLGWGAPGPAAVSWATVVNDPSHVVIFGYEAGQFLAGGLFGYAGSDTSLQR